MLFDVGRRIVARAHRYPAIYFNFKSFRKLLSSTKANVIRRHKMKIARNYCKPEPPGGIVGFLKSIPNMTIEEEGMQEVNARFHGDWKSFATAPEHVMQKVSALPSTSLQNKVLRHLKMFHQGLWPPPSSDNLLKVFAGEPLENEGKQWTNQDCDQLLQLCEKYDVNFGDVWIYIAWEMKRGFEEVEEKYKELIMKNKQQPGHSWELSLDRCSRPLRMNHRFNIDPHTVYVVPTFTKNNVGGSSFRLAKGLREWRNDSIFDE
eukprot:Filipodium_phascolosomae@DN3158_c0_g1_i1.p1